MYKRRKSNSVNMAQDHLLKEDLSYISITFTKTKYMRFLPIILMVFVFSSCTTVYFQEAQPQGVEPLAEFPEKAIGSYKMELLDTLIIEKDRYSIPEEYENSYSMAEVDSNPDLEIRDNLFYDENIPLTTGIEYKIKNDTLHYKKRVRIYTALSDSTVIKSYKQYLIFNAKDNKKGYWSIFILEPKGRNYSLRMIGDLKSEDDEGTREDSSIYLVDFEKITHFEKIGEKSYLVNPTKSEFKKLLSKGLFQATLEMERIE